MFDPDLTKELALEDINSEKHVRIDTVLPASLVVSSRESNRLRSLCFANRENYQKYLPHLFQTMQATSDELGRTEIFQFLQYNLHVYVQAGILQKQFINDIAESTQKILFELIWNAIEVSDDVQVGMDVTSKGVLLAVNQQDCEFDAAFADRMHKKSAELLERLKDSTPVDQIMADIQTSMTRVIGYIPQDPTQYSFAVRGNGTGHLVTDALYRVHAEKKEAIAVHTFKQLTDFAAFKKGSTDSLFRMYAPRSGLLQEKESTEDDDSGNMDDVFSAGLF